jgi:zinc protease
MYARLLVILLLLPAHVSGAPQIQVWQTSRGVPVYFVETHELPIVDLKLIFDAGSVRDPEQKGGLALLANGLLNLAAAGLSADEVSYEFERLGAQYGAQAGYDSASVELRSLSEQAKLKPALDILQKVLASPDFPEADLTRERNRLLIEIQRNRQSPGEIAQLQFQAAVYGNHPYGTPNEGTAESLVRINRDDLVEFHARYYTVSNAMIALVGDIDRAAAETMAEAVTRQLPEGRKPETIRPVQAPAAGETLRIFHPSTQMHILTGQPGMRYGDPDYFPLYVGNHILGGGGLVSRLFEEVREKRGLSYGASSYFAPRRDLGPFQARISTREDQTEEALAVLHQTIADFIARGPTAEELEAAKKNITGGFPLRLDSNSNIADYIAVIGFYGLPLDYLDKFNERIEAVTVEAIRTAFERRLDVGKFVTVLVGPVAEDAAGAGD